MSKLLEITEEQNVPIARILVQEANLSHAGQLKDELIAALDHYRNSVLVDFSDVNYVDSSFLGALVSSLKYAVAGKLDVAVLNPNKDISDLFALIRLDKVFKIYPNKEEALTKYRK
ncbi:anti-sigma B factor antagonist [Mucilaginibacter yixingensis]|uniref:Anti-sigma B factor antagonist n=1 Tax=Mucilaginibacter yixingensis TaxID=1295612 RepID=A0A2T5JET5_9SPHI|nr:STAS domain-containing protein [Mucilaginibacter yixingensis]PTR00943.1 anti-sigma B factor antagonist [Mucilaginibacter yixingensis]